MGELYFKHLVKERGYSDEFFIDSFGTSDEEEGNSIYPPALKELERHGITGSHRAKKLTNRDVEGFDYILVADTQNLARVHNISCGKAAGKAYRMCDFTDKPRDVADPWYTRSFEIAYRDIVDGCDAFLRYLEENGRLIRR